MDVEQIRKFCLSMPHATEKVQWGNDLVFKIGEKMFAVNKHKQHPNSPKRC
jgi:predicted DNA-binding protein (MmcQ/YjbR family)